MTMRYYQKAAYFFDELREAAGNMPVEFARIEKIIKDCRYHDKTRIEPEDAFDALEKALKYIERYSKDELQQLKDAGFDIEAAVTTMSVDMYIEHQKELRKYMSGEMTEEAKRSIAGSSDKFNMFARFLRAYTSISGFEKDLKKTESKVKALKRVLAGK